MKKRCLPLWFLLALLLLSSCGGKTKTLYIPDRQTTRTESSSRTHKTTLYYDYDEHYNPLAIRLQNDSSQIEQSRSDLEYDEFGRILRQHEYNSLGRLLQSHRFAYDDRGNVLFQETLSLDGLVCEIRWTYDEWDRPLSCETVYGVSRATTMVRYFYDPENRENRVEHFRDGILASYECIQLNEAGQPLVSELFHSDGALYQRKLYGYSDSGEIRIDTYARNRYVEELWLISREVQTYYPYGKLYTSTLDDQATGTYTTNNYFYHEIQIPADCPRKD